MGALNELRVHRKLDKIAEHNYQECLVCRNGVIQQISIEKITVGDIIMLSEGNIIPAHCLLLCGRLSIMGSMESFDYHSKSREDYIEKKAININWKTCQAGGADNNRNNRLESGGSEEGGINGFLLTDQHIMKGKGKALVVAVGCHPLVERRHILSRMGTTSMEKKVHRISEGIYIIYIYIYIEVGRIGIYGAIITFMGMLGNLIFVRLLGGQPVEVYQLADILRYIIIALVILIVTLPWGLNLCLIIYYANSLSKLAKQNILIQKLEGKTTLLYICINIVFDNLSKCNNLIIDKTGLLTDTNPAITSVYCENKVFNLAKGNIKVQDKTAFLLAESICSNNNAFIQKNKTKVNKFIEYIYI